MFGSVDQIGLWVLRPDHRHLKPTVSDYYLTGERNVLKWPVFLFIGMNIVMPYVIGPLL